MSLAAVINTMDQTPDPLKRLAAAVLALAVDDLDTKTHQQSARRFLYGELSEVYAGIVGADFFEVYHRMKKNIERRGVQTFETAAPKRRRTRPHVSAWMHRQ